MPEPDQPNTVVLGVISAPGAATELAERLRAQLAEHIAARLPGVDWSIRFVSDRLVDRPADLSQLIAAARRRVIDEGWQLALCLTDLPLQTARRPVVAHASMTHGVAVLSLPALGAVSVTRRAVEAIVRLVAALAGDPGSGTGPTRRSTAALTRRLRELGHRPEPDGRSVGLVAGVVTGNVRLLLGMLRANRPWRLAVRLSRALVAALAAAVFALVTSDIWRLADGIGPGRLGVLAVCSVTAVVVSLIVGAGLWERAPADGSGREQIILFNIVTLATVLIGVLALYLALLALNLVGAFPVGTAAVARRRGGAPGRRPGRGRTGLVGDLGGHHRWRARRRPGKRRGGARGGLRVPAGRPALPLTGAILVGRVRLTRYRSTMGWKRQR